MRLCMQRAVSKKRLNTCSHLPHRAAEGAPSLDRTTALLLENLDLVHLVSTFGRSWRVYLRLYAQGDGEGKRLKRLTCRLLGDKSREPVIRFELMTNGLQNRCSTTELNRQ
jgi:hypothetical protein